VRSLRSGALVLILALIATACGASQTPPAAPSTAAVATSTVMATAKPPADKVTLTGINSTELNLPTLVAIAKGYFVEENIELQDLVIGSSGTLRQAMIAKQYDWGLYAFVHVPIARLAGAPFKVIASIHNQEFFALIVRSQLKDTVKAVKDLRGKKIGYTTPGAATWAIGNVFLKKAGLDPEKDAEFISLGGDNSVFYTALQSGRVDAIVSFEPITQRVLTDNVGYFLIDLYAPGQHMEWVGSDKAAALHLVTREDVLATKPDLAKRMVNVQKKGLAFIRSNTAAAITDTVLGNTTSAAQFQGLDKTLVIKLIEHIKGGFGDGCVSKSGFDTEMKIALDYKLVTGPITFEQFADTSLAGACP
jgi:ABC-type nitrate/sulfonate/bicarbonate transport system substrate-binding protein